MANALLEGLAFFKAQASPVLIGLLLISLSYIPILLLFSKKEQENSFSAYSLLALFFAISLIARLAFINKLTVPLYFDSAEHIRIIDAILDGSTNIYALTPTYYHIGFHLLLSAFANILKINSAQTVLIFGQIILTLIPLPVFLFTWHETRSTLAAFFSAILASFAWSMPGFAINWGKYPMLTGIFFGSSVLLYIYLLQQPKKRYKIGVGLGILISILIHSRLLIFFSIAGLSWLLAQKISALNPHQQRIALGFGLASVLITGLLIEKNDLLKLALEPYLTSPGRYTTLLVLLLSPFAYKKSSKFFFFNLFLTAGLFISLFIPFVQIFLRLGNLTLLDRPFVETVLYLPLAMTGGLGLAWITKNVHIPKPFKKNLVFAALIGLFAFYSLQNYDFLPSPCCNFVSSDDISAMTWIKNNIPTEANILIAGEPLNVVPGTASQNLIGTDAGIWVSNLTERKTLKLLYSRDFSEESVFAFLCQQGVDYIYAGNQVFSFNKSLHTNDSGWYQEVLSLPKVRLFALKNCPE